MNLTALFGAMGMGEKQQLIQLIGNNIAGTPNPPPTQTAPPIVAAGLLAAGGDFADPTTDLPQDQPGNRQTSSTLAGLRQPQLPPGIDQRRQASLLATVVDNLRGTPAEDDGEMPMAPGGKAAATTLSTPVHGSGSTSAFASGQPMTADQMLAALAAEDAGAAMDGNAGSTLASGSVDPKLQAAILTERPVEGRLPPDPKPSKAPTAERIDVSLLPGEISERESEHGGEIRLAPPVTATYDAATIDDGRGGNLADAGVEAETEATESTARTPASPGSASASASATGEALLRNAATRAADATLEAAREQQAEGLETLANDKAAMAAGGTRAADGSGMNSANRLAFEAVLPPDLTAGGEAISETRLGGAILNAAMIPGWPPPRPFVNNLAKQLGDADPKAREAALATLFGSLGLLGIGKKLIDRMRRRLAKLLKQVDMLIDTAVLYATVMVVMQSITDELALLSEGEDDADRGRTRGGRHRIG